MTKYMRRFYFLLLIAVYISQLSFTAKLCVVSKGNKHNWIRIYLNMSFSISVLFGSTWLACIKSAAGAYMSLPVSVQFPSVSGQNVTRLFI